MKADRKGMFPRTVTAGVVAAVTAVLLAACTPPPMSHVRARNAQALTRLEVGMTRDQVLNLMGREPVKARVIDPDKPSRDLEWIDVPHPHRTESYEAAGRRFEVLYYLAAETARDASVSDDELAPVVLIDGRVEGWGWGFWNDQVRRYEIRVR